MSIVKQIEIKLERRIYPWGGPGDWSNRLRVIYDNGAIFETGGPAHETVEEAIRSAYDLLRSIEKNV